MNQRPLESECASFGQRLLARVIDFAFVLAGSIVAATLVEQGELWVDAARCLSFACIFYLILGDWLFRGAALGKRCLGIYVVDARTRQPCSLFQCAIRQCTTAVLLGLVIELPMLAADGRQRWGDRWAKTYVLRRKAVAAIARTDGDPPASIVDTV